MSPYRDAAYVEPDPPVPEPPEAELDEVPPVPLVEESDGEKRIAKIVGVGVIAYFAVVAAVLLLIGR